MKTVYIKILALLLLFYSNDTLAQKFGYIDTEFILNKIPEYGEAQKELDKIASEYQTEIEGMRDKLSKEYSEYKAEEILLTSDLKKEREDTLEARQKRVNDYQRKIFGYNGLIFLKRQELVKPIQDKVYAAVEGVCKAKRLAIMFDKSGDMSMIYTNVVHDYTDYVLEELGLGDEEDTIDNERFRWSELKGKRKKKR